MTPDHGTTSRYKVGCRCDACRDNQRRRMTKWRLRTGEDRVRGARTVARPDRIDATPVRAHIAALIASGWSLAAIDREVGLVRHAYKIANGRHPKILRETAAAILAVSPLPDPASVVDEVAVERVLAGNAPLTSLTPAERDACRVAAARRGWTAAEISRHLGASGSKARAIVEGVAV